MHIPAARIRRDTTMLKWMTQTEKECKRIHITVNAAAALLRGLRPEEVHTTVIMQRSPLVMNASIVGPCEEYTPEQGVKQNEEELMSFKVHARRCAHKEIYHTIVSNSWDATRLF